MYKISRAKYADMYGPTTGDRIRLADTALVIQVERDAARYGEEAKFAGENPCGTAWASPVRCGMKTALIPSSPAR